MPTPTASSAVHGSFRGAQPFVRIALVAVPFALFGCRDPKVTSYTVPKEPAAELPASTPVHDPAPPATVASPAPTLAATEPGAAVPTSAAPASNPHALQTAGGDALMWTAPGAWQAKPATMMRKATFTITGEGGATAELAISAFPGDVGGEAANVNRWRGQAGMDPVADAVAVASIVRIETNGLKIGLVDAGDGTNRLIGAMVPYAGATWFFKLTGPDAVVGKAKPDFVAFLSTVKPAAAATP